MSDEGRWPANLILDRAAAALLDTVSANTRAAKNSGGGLSTGTNPRLYGEFRGGYPKKAHNEDEGGASRFFHVYDDADTEPTKGGRAVAWQVLHGDNRAVMATMADESVHAIVTDPPYEIGFMSKRWDNSGIAYDPAVWAEAKRVLKPGGHMLVFGGTRTHHRLMCAIEDAGFEIRDCLMWLYGSGFPKSRNIGKAIDKAAGVERPVLDTYRAATKSGATGGSIGNYTATGEQTYATVTEAVTEDAKRWDGWGTQLKPAWEPIILARKPYRGPVEQNVLTHGTGALNIEACSIATDNKNTFPVGVTNDTESVYGGSDSSPNARWPANLLLDEDAAAALDAASGTSKSTSSGYDWAPSGNGNAAHVTANIKSGVHFDDSGGASRFFYVAKSATKERNKGLKGKVPKGFAATMGNGIGEREHDAAEPAAWQENDHPTVKPVQLCRYLVRLITPPGGTVLDIFMGSGSTGVAAAREGFDFIGIDENARYCAIARARIEQAAQQMHLPLGI